MGGLGAHCGRTGYPAVAVVSLGRRRLRVSLCGVWLGKTRAYSSELSSTEAHRLCLLQDVHFQTQSETITINVRPETVADPDPASAQLAPSVEREKEGKRERE